MIDAPHRTTRSRIIKIVFLNIFFFILISYLIADADPKNVFDMERYMKKQRTVVKPTDSFDVYEIDATT